MKLIARKEFMLPKPGWPNGGCCILLSDSPGADAGISPLGISGGVWPEGISGGVWPSGSSGSSSPSGSAGGSPAGISPEGISGIWPVGIPEGIFPPGIIVGKLLCIPEIPDIIPIPGACIPSICIVFDCWGINCVVCCWPDTLLITPAKLGVLLVRVLRFWVFWVKELLLNWLTRIIRILHLQKIHTSLMKFFVIDVSLIGLGFSNFSVHEKISRRFTTGDLFSRSYVLRTALLDDFSSLPH